MDQEKATYSHSGTLFGLKKKEILPSAETWLNPEETLPSER